MIKVTDYIAKRLKEYGVKDVFMITGGGAMHLNDSLGKTFNCIHNHHEQATAIGAEGYARVTGKLAVVNVTSGPGGLNTLTGVSGQWTDSIPVLYLSGQVKFETTIAACPSIGLRQLGDQETDIVNVVRPIVKYSVMLVSAEDVRYELEKAIDIATTGRPGPVWIDVPLNIQGAMVDEHSLKSYLTNDPTPKKPSKNEIDSIIKRIKEAKRPVVLAGHGIRISGGVKDFIQFISSCNIPVVTTFNGMDVIGEDNPNYVGRFGTLGSRSGNFVVQNSDLLITIGTRNNIRQVSYNWQSFAKEAFKIIIDIDSAELKKPTLVPDMAICADAREVILALKNSLTDFSGYHVDWLKWCNERKEKYPTVLPEYYKQDNKLHPYVFINKLSELLKDSDICVAGNGTACVAAFQAMKVKQGQRVFWNSGCATMGYDLPASIGASFANNKGSVICLAGDGSIQMNLQELQTIIHHQLPVKIFYLNNNGYVSQRQTQDSFFNGFRVGADPASGVSFPDIIKLGAAYGFQTFQIKGQNEMEDILPAVLSCNQPVICEVLLPDDYKFSPKLSSKKLDDGRMVSSPLEDLAPFLDREEFKSNLLIKEWIAE
ncbi:MAG TPA: thiamine pyrophosphate-binding protein [Cyclobacteriaceae bacterium]